MKLWTGFGFATAFALAIGLVSAYGLAQPKPGAPAKPAPQSGPAGHEHHGHDCCDKGSCAECDCGGCAKSGAGMACDAGMCGGHGKHADMHCPMTQLASLADVKVENTKTGATLQLTAKDPSKAGEVQALAGKLAEHLKAGGCPMEKSGPGMMPGHQHGAPSASPGKAPDAGAAAAPKK
jgi:hypothetical protein